MLRLAVITSEALKSADPRYMRPLSRKLATLSHLKIGHWGDAVGEQVPVLTNLVRQNPHITFWWYTRKQDVALAVNEYGLRNLRAYLSLDPATSYPSPNQYPFGITYLFGDNLFHPDHRRILSDDRLVAVFPMKKGAFIEDPGSYGLAHHPKLCEEKKRRSELGARGEGICLSCPGRCNYNPL
jgi:hypothetical protein